MKAVFADAGSFGKGENYEGLKSLPLEWEFYDQTPPSEVITRLKDAQIAVVNKVLMTREVMAALPRLKLICETATGVDNIDVAAAKEQGIAVCNVAGYSTGTVTQLTVLMILALANSFLPYVNDVKKGRWPKSPHFCFLDYPIGEVRGKTLGILGYGNLGKEVARVATALGMRIAIVERSKGVPAGVLPLPDVLKISDFFTIHTPLTPQTRNLIGKNELALMKPTAYIINISRGGIINEEALAEALKSHRIAGAGIDVLTKEPPLPDHPLLDPSIPNLLLTPHIGWASKEARQTILETTKESIAAFLQGKLQNQV